MVNVDFDQARDVYRRNSMSAYIFWLFGELVSWMSEQQVVVTFPIVAEKYVAAT